MALDTACERIWAEVDLGCIVHNYKQAERLAKGAALLPVVKANAYGHGDIEVARALLAAGAARFAVATAAEAKRLRQAGILEPILVLGMVPAACVAELVAAGVSLCCGSLATAKQYVAALGRVSHVYGIKLHIKLDTGMGRLGLEPAAALEEAVAIAALPGVTVEGLFTHFAASDDATQNEYTVAQLAGLVSMVAALRQKGIRPGLVHAANSGGILLHPEAHLDMVRPGIMLYGYAPGPDAAVADLRPAMSVRARILQVREIPAGQAVSYGLTWRASRPSRIATVSAGYADGVHRAGSGGYHMLVRGKRAPQVGRVCMDMTMLDVTEIPGAQAGDIATLVGRDGKAFIGADEVAAAAGTISYEVLCAQSARVPRYYLNHE